MDQKSIKNRPQIARADGVPRFWSRAQVVLDFGALLGSSWRRHGSVLAGKSGQHGPNLAPSWRPKREAKSVLGRPGGVLGASWRVHVTDLMHFGCIFAARLKKYAFEVDF